MTSCRPLLLTAALTVAAGVLPSAALAAAPGATSTTGSTTGRTTGQAHGPAQGRATAAGRSAAPGRTDGVVPGAYLVVRRDDAATVAEPRATAAVRAARAEGLRRLAARVGATPRATTTTALASFTAALRPDQVDRLRRDPEVLAVRPVRRHRLAAVDTPGFLGLTGSGPGTWEAAGGPAEAGRGVVVGLVDSGIWAESPAFRAGVPDLGAAPGGVGEAYRPTPTTTAVRKADGGLFTGDCSGRAGTAPVQDWSPDLCNGALVSARAFPPSVGFDPASPTDPRGAEYTSPRDSTGHGTHTASTAAGRTTTARLWDGTYLTEPDGSVATSTGIAPGAAVAEYKACWTQRVDGDLDGAWDNYCTDDSLVAAIDQAVHDGVDVLNFSISGTTDDPLDPVELAMLGAARAGVLVVASAGNDGPTLHSVNHPVPWVLTVGDASYTRTWTDLSHAPSTVDDTSGRGPATAYAGAVLKPDLVAPGTDVIASVPPPSGQPADTGVVASLTGTSMAAPHVSGLAAVMLGEHPTWTAPMVRSAIGTTTARIVGESLFAQGSGMINARRAAGAELLLDVPPQQYTGAARFAGLPGTTAPVNPSDVNLPTITLPDVAAKSTTRRVLTATRPGVWQIGGSAPGYDVRVSPRRGLALAAGQRILVTVTVRRTTASRGLYVAGSVAMSSPRGTQRIPLVLRTR